MVWAQRGSTKTQEEEQGEQAQTKGRGWRPRVLGRHGSAPPRLSAEEAARAEGGRVVRSGPGVRSARGAAWLRRRLTREGAVEHTHAHEGTHEHAHPGAGALSQGAGWDEGETAARGVAAGV